MASRARIAIGCPSGSEAPHLKLNSAACAGQRRIVGAAAAIVVPTSSVLRDNFIVISSLELESAAGGCLSPRKVPVQRNPCQAALVIFAAKPAWWARSLYMYHTTATEPVGVILAMQTTQEGQMPGLIGEVLLPAFDALNFQAVRSDNGAVLAGHVLCGQVRNGLSPGGRRIRTLGPACLARRDPQGVPKAWGATGGVLGRRATSSQLHLGV